jgi:regulator of cell morphogenesis and NO signaling
MNTYTESDTVGDVVRRDPALARVFERRSIDYCCGGKKTLATACSEKGLDVDAFLSELDREKIVNPGLDVNPDTLSLSDLTTHIEVKHHAYLKRELPRLIALSTKVANAHGDREARLLEIKKVVEHTVSDMMQHMAKEELVLFPMIRAMEMDGTANTALEAPMQRMEAEHDDAGDALQRLNTLTDAYAPPSWACTSYRTLFAALQEFEQDMHRHVHKENNILFPKVRAILIHAEGVAR